MKKKLIVLLTALCLVAALTVTASAAPSVSAEAAPSISAAVTGTGAEIPASDLAVTAVADVDSLPAEKAEKLEAAYTEIRAASSVAGFIEEKGLTSAVATALESAKEDVTVKDLVPHSLFDVSAEGEAAKVLKENGSITLSFKVPSIDKGDAAVVLHQTGDKWEVVPSTTADGVVSATFTSLSPVMVLVSRASAPVVSPQTGDASFSMLLCCAGICLIGMLYCGKKAYSK